MTTLGTYMYAHMYVPPITCRVIGKGTYVCICTQPTPTIVVDVWWKHISSVTGLMTIVYVVPSEEVLHPARLCDCAIISSQRLGAGRETSEEDCYSLHATDTVYVRSIPSPSSSAAVCWYL